MKTDNVFGQDNHDANGAVALTMTNGTLDCCPGLNMIEANVTTERITLANGIPAKLANMGANAGGLYLWFEQDKRLISMNSPLLTKEQLLQVAASLSKTADIGKAAEPPARPTPTPLAPLEYSILRPTWLPEAMTVREQREGDSMIFGFDPRPNDAPHGVLTLHETPKAQITPSGKPDPQETHQQMGGYDLTIIKRRQDCITLIWIEGDLQLTLTNPYDPPGHPRYSCDQLAKIVESIKSPSLTSSATPSGRLLTLEEAKTKVRSFLGEPQAKLDGYLMDRSIRKDYALTRQVNGARWPDEFTVNAETGEIFEALLNSNTLSDSSSSPLDDTQAKQKAEEFARSHFAGFESLAFHEADGLSRAANGDTIYTVRWQSRATDSGAWLPTFVWVGVDVASGRVVSYTGQHLDYQGVMVPKITRERAIQIALAEAHMDTRLMRATAGKVELQAGPANGNDKQFELVWFVGLEGIPEGVAIRHFTISAITGAILNPVSSPLG